MCLKPRSWHIGLPRYHAGSTECQVVVFGGNVHVKGDKGARDNTADLRILQFGGWAIGYLWNVPIMIIDIET